MCNLAVLHLYSFSINNILVTVFMTVKVSQYLIFDEKNFNTVKSTTWYMFSKVIKCLVKSNKEINTKHLERNQLQKTIEYKTYGNTKLPNGWTYK